MTKIAIPVLNGQINNLIGDTQQFYVCKIVKNSIVEEKVLSPPDHEPGVYPKWLAEIGVTNVIAESMGHKAMALFNQNKINVFVGVSIKTPKELVMDLLNGTLETNDNSCSH
ncbi:NifB/NifX family molybdenum-iron cluster-binding protein [Labilibaculum antarcticum]|uniref:ATPase n=1 Tax=Labilibaculum antarcticum TaxID=1717717 RepID=A0A1Y1CDK6_9BACT|nr:NifB/NifX family molybdenum-iron cluster-binding protein [Labilibaculum antarcticum]BAX78426.1 ATPase [Labilibaculum antarcticum]